MAGDDSPRRARTKSYTDGFRCDTVRLVTEQRYSIAAAAEAIGASDPKGVGRFKDPIRKSRCRYLRDGKTHCKSGCKIFLESSVRLSNASSPY